MKTFLARGENVDGFVKKQLSGHYTAECPACHGYGGWNLELNAYGPGKHFSACCYQCYGWGYVKAGSLSAICVHEFEEVSPSGNGSGIHTDRCSKCGWRQSRDTSD